MYMKLMIYLISNEQARDETGRSNKVLRGEHYALIVICVFV